VLILRSRIRN